MIWTIVITCTVFYAAILVVVYFLQGKMVYFPSPTIAATPADIGLEYEDVTMVTDDSVNIHGWYIPADSARATIIHCHGNAGNISGRLETIRQFNRLGLNVLIFDYHGYGRSEGVPSEDGTYFDAAAAWNYVTEEKGEPPDRIIIFGRSLGGAIAVWLATQRPAAGLIVESSFLSIPDIARTHYPFLPVGLLAKYKYNTKRRIPTIHMPVLVIHSPDDNTVPYSHGKKIFELANEPKQFLQISGGHNDGFLESAKTYEPTISAFVDVCVDNK